MEQAWVRSFREIFFVEVGKAFVFRKLRPTLRYQFSRAGFSEVPYAFFGTAFWLTVVMTATLYLLRVFPWLASLRLNAIEFFFGVFLSWLVIHGLFVALTIFVIYAYLDLRISARIHAMEATLQDYLQFVSENLKGGMSFERALWSAIRPQFGVLAEEMRLAAKKVMTGEDIEEALSEFTSKYPSPLLRRSFDLITEGTKGGGEVADTIDRVVENLEELKELKAEIRATNLTYLMFVGIVVSFVAPLLFALSYQFLTILSAFSSRLDITQSGGAAGLNAAFGFGKANINLADFRLFSQGALFVTGIFASFIVSIIQQGDVRDGVKYIPIFVGLSLLFYFIFSWVGGAIFGGLVNVT